MKAGSSFLLPYLGNNAVLLDSMCYWKHYNTVQSPPIMKGVKLNVLFFRMKIPWLIPRTRLGKVMGAHDLCSFAKCRSGVYMVAGLLAMSCKRCSIKNRSDVYL